MLRRNHQNYFDDYRPIHQDYLDDFGVYADIPAYKKNSLIFCKGLVEHFWMAVIVFCARCFSKNFAAHERSDCDN